LDAQARADFPDSYIFLTLIISQRGGRPEEFGENGSDFDFLPKPEGAVGFPAQDTK
jgi:hypothetical protein